MAKYYTEVRRRREYGTGHLILDLILVVATGGLWLIWLLIRFLRNH